MDRSAFHKLSYGMYLITTQGKDRAAGCVVNTFAQVTSSPFQVTVALNKDNATTAALLENGRYVATCLSEDADMDLIRTFGFATSADTDKFVGRAKAFDESGIPYVNEGFCARFSVRVTDKLDVGTHIIFVGEVEDAAEGPGDPMTYAYYHQVKGGKTPPKASSYVPEEPQPEPAKPAEGAVVAWQCKVCGFTVYQAELPDDFECPICGAGKENFIRMEL